MIFLYIPELYGIRHIIIIITVLTGLCLYVNSQEADIRISELINESEWFALADEYPKLKSSL